MLLTPKERVKFVEWLKQDADSNKQLIQQMEAQSIYDAIVKQKKQQIAACLIVANMLEDAEDFTIGG